MTNGFNKKGISGHIILYILSPPLIGDIIVSHKKKVFFDALPKQNDRKKLTMINVYS